MTIVAPPEVIHTWQEESARLLAAARRVADPALAETLHHAAGILLASAVNASPVALGLFQDGLKRLVDEVIAEQQASGGIGAECPLPLDDGSARRCTRGPAGQSICSDAAFDAGTGELGLGGRAS